MTVEFEAPGAGFWELDRSHYPGGVTPIVAHLTTEGPKEAYRKLAATVGLPFETLSVEMVQGFMYTRIRPLVSPDKPPKKNPPALVLKVASRLHPAFRARNKAAARTLAERPWRAETHRWHAEIRPTLERQNLAFQDVDLAGLDDGALADHLAALLTHLRGTYEEHHRLHGYDLGPLGMLVSRCNQWGIDTADVLPTLAGASPSTSAPTAALAEIKAAIDATGADPRSLDDVRAISPEVADQLDRYLRHRSAVLCAGYDLDTPTLGEVPAVVLATITGHTVPDEATAARADEAADAVRARLATADDREEFDTLLTDARAAMDMRDDNGPLTIQWPTGLLRLAMLEAGRRLVEAGYIDDVDHVFELTHHELVPMVRRHDGPAGDELAARAAARVAQKALDPPLTLGDPEPEPDLDTLPAPLATQVRVITSLLGELGIQARDDVDLSSAAGLQGAGIGTEAVTGRARTADSAEDAIAELQPGEILVTRATSPAYNLVLTMVGGLVTSEGGPMSHAAVLARELGFPAVVGAAGAIDQIADGDTITVDPATGTVTVVAAA